MDLEELLHEAEHRYFGNVLFRALLDTIVETVAYEVGDPEIDHCLQEVARRAAAVALIMSEGKEW